MNNGETNKITNNMLKVFYVFFVLALIVGIYIWYIERYAVYFINDDIILNNGDTFQLELLPKNFDYYNSSNYIYTSENPSIAKVDSNGLITGVSDGSTFVKVKFKNSLQSEKVAVKIESVDVKNINIEKNITIEKNSTQKIKPTINNNDKINANLKYKSKDTNVVKVDDYGNVTGLKKGNTTIEVESENGVKQSVEVNVIEVNSDIEKIYIEEDNNSMFVSDSKNLKVNIMPPQANTNGLKWTSSNENVAIVDNNGKVTALKEGTAVISVKTKNSLEAQTIIEVKEKKELSIIVPSKDIYEGDNILLTTNEYVTWSSNNEDIASIDSDGYLSAKKEGKVIISAKSIDGRTAKVELEIKNKKVENVEASSIILSSNSVTIEEKTSFNLTYTIKPSNANNKNVVWSSSNENVATVVNGKVTALKEGKSTITVKTSNSKTATCEVVVKKQIIDVKTVKFETNNTKLFVGDSKTIGIKITPDNASNKNITYISSDPNIAIVDSKGKITALKEGNVTITAKSYNGIADTCSVIIEKKIIDVNKVNLDKKSINLTKGDKTTLHVTVTPSNATNKKVTWSSDNKNVVQISQSGQITAVGPGITTVKVKSNNGITDTCKVSVENKIIKVESIVLKEKDFTMFEGDTKTLEATITPSNATNKNIKWTSTDKTIAKVETSTGKITALKEGKVTITGTIDNVSVKSIVTVKKDVVKAEKITLTPQTSTINIGSSVNLNATISPTNVSDKTITWTSTNPSVASVNSSGVVTGLKKGNTTITATTNNGKYARANIIVNELLPSSVSLNKTRANIGINETIKLTATINPQGANNKSLTWSSSDTNVATVENGNVTGKKAGTVEITVKTINNKQAKATIVVDPVLPSSITLNKTKLELPIGNSEKITATVLPKDTSDKIVTWKSNNDGVASVDSTGKVTAKKAGTTVITASTSNGITANCTVVVRDTLNLANICIKSKVIEDGKKDSKLQVGKSIIQTHLCMKDLPSFQNFGVSNKYVYLSLPIVYPWCEVGKLIKNTNIICRENDDSTIKRLSRNKIAKYNAETQTQVAAAYVDYAGHAQCFDVTKDDEIYLNYFANTDLKHPSENKIGAGSGGFGIFKNFDTTGDIYPYIAYRIREKEIKEDGKISYDHKSYIIDPYTGADIRKNITKESTIAGIKHHPQVAVDENSNKLLIMSSQKTKDNKNYVAIIYDLSDFKNRKATKLATIYLGQICSGGETYCGGQGINIYGNYIYAVQDYNNYANITQIDYTTCSKTDQINANCTSKKSININKYAYGDSKSDKVEVEGISINNGHVFISLYNQTKGKSKIILVDDINGHFSAKIK